MVDSSKLTPLISPLKYGQKSSNSVQAQYPGQKNSWKEVTEQLRGAVPPPAAGGHDILREDASMVEEPYDAAPFLKPDIPKTPFDVKRERAKRQRGRRKQNRGKIDPATADKSAPVPTDPGTEKRRQPEPPAPAAPEPGKVPSPPPKSPFDASTAAIAIDPWALTQVYNRKLIWGYITDDTVRVNGTFTFLVDGKPTSRVIVGVFELVRDQCVVSSASTCGTILLCSNNVGNTFLTYNDVAARLGLSRSKGVDDRVRECAHAMISKCISHQYTYDSNFIAQQIEVEYQRHYERFPALKSTIVAVMNEPWFQQRNFAYVRSMANNWTYVTKLRLSKYYADRGQDFDIIHTSSMHWLCFRLLHRVGVPILGAITGMLMSQHVTPEILGAVLITSMLTLFIVTCGAVAGLQANDAFTGLMSMGLENYCLHTMVSDITLPKAMSIIPCAKVLLRKSVYQRDIRPFPAMAPEAKLVVDPIPVAKEQFVEIFGTSTNATMTYPARDDLNMEAAIRIRMAAERAINEDTMNDFIKFARSEIDKLDPIELDPPDTMTWLKQQYGARRATIIWEECKEPLDDRDAVRQLLMKGEAYLGKAPDDFKPRALFAPTNKYLGYFGPQFASLHKQLLSQFSLQHDHFIMSGCKPADVGKFAETLSNMAFLYEIDVSNWDGSIHKRMIEDIEQYFCLTKVTNWKEKDWLFKNWCVISAANRRKSVKYSHIHNRKSGDFHTSDFNGLINILITKYVNRAAHESNKLKSMVAGDDGVVGSNEPLPDNIVRVYSELGMTAVMFPRDNIYACTFCSGSFYNVNGRPLFGGWAFRFLSKFGMNHHNHPPKLFKRLLYGAAKSALPVYRHVPVVGVFLEAIVRSGERKNLTPYYDNRHENPFRVMGGDIFYPSSETYVQFAERYGFDVADVIALEGIMMTVNLDMLPAKLEGDLFDRGIEVDTGTFIGGADITWTSAEEDYLCFTVPMEEEIEKLTGASSYTDAVNNAIKFGQEEIDLGAPASHIALHVLFTTLSYANLNLGVYVHGAYNRLALAIGNSTPCAKKRMKKRNSQPPKQNPASTTSLKGLVKAAVKQALVSGGGAVGGYLGGPSGAILGSGIGAYVSKISGAGDYKIQNNSLMRGSVPIFNDKHSIRFSHKEYLGDISSSTTFSLTALAMNPGLASFLPWGSGIVSKYQQYKIHGMVMCINSLSSDSTGSTNTALGSMIMSTQYNPSQPNFTSKTEMENHEFTTSGPPNMSMIHAIECDPRMTPNNLYYVRESDLPSGQDIKLYDIGTFQLASIGAQAVSTVGELWVSYDIECFKPKMSNGDATQGLAYLSNATSYINGGPLGTQVASYSDLDVSCSTTAITFSPTIQSGSFFIHIEWQGSSTAALSMVMPTLSSNLTDVLFSGTGASIGAHANGVGTTATKLAFVALYKVTGYLAGGATITFTSQVLPSAGAACTVYIVGTDDYLVI